MDSIYCRIDTTGLTQLKRASLEFSTRTPSEMADTTAYFVAKAAWRNTPTTPIGTIDTELAVEVNVKIGPRGGKRKSYGFGINAEKNTEVPYAFLIVLARANLTKLGRATGLSNFNDLTGSRYAIDLTGQTLLSAAQRMIKSRHSSTKFIQAGWIPAIAGLAKYVPQYATRGSGAGPATSNKAAGKDFGDYIPAQTGSTYAVATIENRIGMSGQFLDEKRNEALWRVAGPALQRAIDQEYNSTLEYIFKKASREHFSKLEQFGFKYIDV